MKLLVLLALVSLSAFSRDACEQMGYTAEYIDYDSELNGSCAKMIQMLMKDKGCSKETTKKVHYSSVLKMEQGSSMMCIYKNKSGIYQLMASQMAEPHKAVAMFSVWD
ncbi:MAG: hypothetical protein CME64_11795 [Halobacteriovoraceae bacterium]|nr:hypothetical protein [Halobacteriovoraceae bacterium]|tara:strand:+ start:106319 stop:106642 length:324 start_codon:yes stop_codon:yes gene_type:complete